MLSLKPTKFYSDRDITQARVAKNSVTCQVRDFELELSKCCLVDLNNDVSRWKCFACQLPSFYSNQSFI